MIDEADLINWPELLKLCALKSRPAYDYHVGATGAPLPVKIAGRQFWRKTEVERWLYEKSQLKQMESSLKIIQQALILHQRYARIDGERRWVPTAREEAIGEAIDQALANIMEQIAVLKKKLKEFDDEQPE